MPKSSKVQASDFQTLLQQGIEKMARRAEERRRAMESGEAEQALDSAGPIPTMAGGVALETVVSAAGCEQNHGGASVEAGDEEEGENPQLQELP